MRAGFPTETRRYRSSEEAHTLLERQALPQKTMIIFEASFGFHLL
jgi:hypothetical protein